MKRYLAIFFLLIFPCFSQFSPLDRHAMAYELSVGGTVPEVNTDNSNSGSQEQNASELISVEQISASEFRLKTSSGAATFLLGGAYQDAGSVHINEFASSYMNVLNTLDTQGIAETISQNSHNTVKIYLPKDNPTDSDFQQLRAFITEMNQTYGLRFLVCTFAGLYAQSADGNYLLYNPTEANIAAVKNMIKELAEELKDLGGAVAGVQIGNENEYYVKGASRIYWSSSDQNTQWDKINLSREEYYSFMNTLAGEYKSVDPNHLVFLGHGMIFSEQVPVIKDRDSNFDGFAFNYYPNQQDSGLGVHLLSISDLTTAFQNDFALLAQLGKPILITEFGESSYQLGLNQQAQYMLNFTAVARKYMSGNTESGVEACPKILIGLIVHEYTSESWKDIEAVKNNPATRPFQAGLALFDNYEPKPAFTTLSQGYADILAQLSNITETSPNYYLLDSQGLIYANELPDFLANSPLPDFGWDISRDLEFTPDGKGLYILDGFGVPHCHGTASRFADASGAVCPWSDPQDLSRAIKVTPTAKGYYILQSSGTVNPYGDAQDAYYGNASFENGETAEDMEFVLDQNDNIIGYYVLGSKGAILRFGDSQNLPDFDKILSVTYGTAKKLRLTSDAHGAYVLDDCGIVHALGEAQAPSTLIKTGQTALPIFTSAGTARDIEVVNNSSGEVTGIYTADKAGNIYAVGNIPELYGANGSVREEGIRGFILPDNIGKHARVTVASDTKEVTFDPAPVSRYYIGETITVKAIASNFSENLAFTWYLEPKTNPIIFYDEQDATGEPLVSELTYRIASEAPGTYTLKLDIKNADTLEVLYTQTWNNIGIEAVPVPKQIQLTALTIPPTNAKAGESLSASVSAKYSDGTDGTFSYEWYFDGVTIPSAASSSLTYTLPSTLLAGSTHTLAVKVSDGSREASLNWYVKITESSVVSIIVTPLLNPASPVYAGDRISASVSAKYSNGSMGIFSYKWYFNGGLIESARSSSLINYPIPSTVEVGESYPLAVEVSGNGKTNSYSWSVKIHETERNIVVTPAFNPPAQVKAGDKITAAVSAKYSDGTPGIFTYKWLFMGQELSAASSILSNYVIPDTVQPGESYYLAAQVSAGGKSGSYAWSIKIIGSVERSIVITPILNPPLTAKAGDSVSASVSAKYSDGTSGTFTYQWYFDGSAIASAASSSLTYALPSTLSAGSNHTLAVSVSSGGKTNSYDWPIKISEPVQRSIVITPTLNPPLTAKAGESVSASVSAKYSDGTNGTFTYQWYFDGSAIASATSNSLTYALPSTLNAGTNHILAVEASSGEKRNSISWTIRVIQSPSRSIVITPLINPAAAAKIGDTVSASVTAAYSDGTSGTFSYQWSFNNAVIPQVTSNTLTAYTIPSTTTAGTTAVLKVTVSSGTLSKEYTWNIAITYPDLNISLTAVTNAPSSARAGDSVSAAVNAQYSNGTNGTFSYKWYFNDVEIPSATGSALSNFIIPSTVIVGNSYVLKVTVSDGSKSSYLSWNIRISVPETPDIVLTPVTNAPYSAKRGDKISAAVNAAFVDGTNGTFTYQWYFNSELIPGAASSTLNEYIIPSTVVAGNAYPLVVTVSSGTKSAFYRWYIKIPRENTFRRVILTPNPAAIAPITTGTLISAAVTALYEDGTSGDFSYKWYFNLQEIPNQTSSTLSNYQVTANPSVTTDYFLAVLVTDNTTKQTFSHPWNIRVLGKNPETGN